MKTLLLALWLLSNFAYAQQATEFPFKWERTLGRGRDNAVARAQWDTLSKVRPAFHNPENFIYLITEIEAPRITKFTLMQILNPQIVAKNMRICSSAIGRFSEQGRKKVNVTEFYGTFRGRIALILNSPSLNVGPMYYADMSTGSPPWQAELTDQERYEKNIPMLAGLYRMGNYGRPFNIIYTPKELINATIENRFSYNEVDLIGTNFSKVVFNENGQQDFSKVTVDGFMVECGRKAVKNELADLFIYPTVKLDPSLSDEKKMSLLETCLGDDTERISPENGLIRALVDKNKNDLYPIILLNQV